MLRQRAAPTGIRSRLSRCLGYGGHSPGVFYSRQRGCNFPVPCSRQSAVSVAAASATPQAPTGIQQMLEEAMEDENSFMEIMLRGRPGQNTTSPAIRTASIRPVLLRNRRQLQFSLFDGKQTLVKNYPAEEAQQELSRLLDLMSCSSILLRSADEEVNVQVSRKGKPIIHRSSVARPLDVPHCDADTSTGVRLQHDRTKQLPISPNEPHVFLKKLGMQTADGRIKADMQDKFTQVNEFLKLLGHTGALERWAQHAEAPLQMPSAFGLVQVPDLAKRAQASSQPAGAGAVTQHASSSQAVCILDCGCGSSHLTFGTFHYLNNVLQIPARIMGVDTNHALMERSNMHCRGLGLNEDRAQFFTSPILQFASQCPVQPDVVLALHACDTATDEALALGIKKGATVIMAVPCCHKHLHRQMASLDTPAAFRPLMRHGIMKQRQIDMLTDTFRAQLLRIMGYKTDAVEFTSAEHTPRNLLIRAVRSAQTVARSSREQDKMLQDMIQEYDELKAFWGGMTPHLEMLVQPELADLRARLSSV